MSGKIVSLSFSSLICLITLAGSAQSQQLLPVPSLGAPLSTGQLPPSDHPMPGRQVTVPSAVPTAVGGVTRWSGSCLTMPATLVIVESPQHGVTGMRDEQSVIPARNASGESVACAGYPVVRKALYYQSSPGFRGADRMVYATEHGRYTVEITVQ